MIIFENGDFDDEYGLQSYVGSHGEELSLCVTYDEAMLIQKALLKAIANAWFFEAEPCGRIQRVIDDFINSKIEQIGKWIAEQGYYLTDHEFNWSFTYKEVSEELNVPISFLNHYGQAICTQTLYDENVAECTCEEDEFYVTFYFED